MFYVGMEKNKTPDEHNSTKLYEAVLREAIKRLDHFCTEDCPTSENFLLIMDEHPQRKSLLKAACISMYKPEDPRRTLIEPPFQAESDRYQTLQAADWIAALIGRMGVFWKNQDSYPENEIFCKYFEHRIQQAQRRSGIR